MPKPSMIRSLLIAERTRGRNIDPTGVVSEGALLANGSEDPWPGLPGGPPAASFGPPPMDAPDIPTPGKPGADPDPGS